MTEELPIYKKVWKEDPGNYRPVSLTFISGKDIEQVILSTHLMDERAAANGM